MSSGLARASIEPVGDASSSATRGPPVVAEQVATMAEVALGHPVRAWQQLRRAPVPVVAIEVEEIVQEPTLPPQLLRTVIQRSEEFEMLEEGMRAWKQRR